MLAKTDNVANVYPAECYSAFVALCKQRIIDLNIPYATVDQLCGFPDRYTNALLSGGKACSIWSFFTLARALALMPQFAHDPLQLARLKDQSAWIPRQTRRRVYHPPRGRPRKHRSVLELDALAGNPDICPDLSSQ